MTAGDWKGDTASGARHIANANARRWDREQKERKEKLAQAPKPQTSIPYKCVCGHVAMGHAVKDQDGIWRHCVGPCIYCKCPKFRLEIQNTQGEGKMKQVDDEEDDYRKKAAEHRKEKLSKGLFKLPEGETRIRILKTPRDEERNSPSVWVEYYVHRNVGPKKLTFRCGKSVIDDSGACWLCKVVRLLKEKGKTKMAAQLEKQKVYAVQVAVWDEDIDNLRGPLLWPMASGKSAKSISFKVESIVASKKDYLNHKQGYSFTFERQGTGMLDTVYGKTERDEEPSAVPKQIVAKLKPFADVILQYDPEAQKNGYYGKVAEEDDAEERPKKKAAIDEEDADEEPTPKKKKPVPVDEEDEEEPAPKKRKPVDEDEEEEAPPKKKKPADDEDELEEPAPKKKKPVMEDEDEELNFPDEEDEAPAPKKKKPVADEEDDFAEEEPTPKKKKPPVDEDDLEEDEAPPKKKKPAPAEDEDDEDDDEAYLKDEDEDEAPPKKKKKPADDDLEDDLEEEAHPKKRKPVEEDEEDEAPPKKKKKPPVDEDDE